MMSGIGSSIQMVLMLLWFLVYFKSISLYYGRGPCLQITQHLMTNLNFSRYHLIVTFEDKRQ